MQGGLTCPYGNHSCTNYFKMKICFVSFSMYQIFFPQVQVFFPSLTLQQCSKPSLYRYLCLLLKLVRVQGERQYTGSEIGKKNS